MFSELDDDSCANQVVIHVSTTVIIQDFESYYPNTPIQSFYPIYTALSDGSLLLPPTEAKLNESNTFFILNGAILMLYLRNTLVSLRYIRRTRIKHKGLFYVLFLSQLLGLLSAITSAVILTAAVICVGPL